VIDTKPPRARRLADATPPLQVRLTELGFIDVVDADGSLVLSVAPNQVAAIARAFTAATCPPPDAKPRHEAPERAVPRVAGLSIRDILEAHRERPVVIDVEGKKA
jgi:hypothetical protein